MLSSPLSLRASNRYRKDAQRGKGQKENEVEEKVKAVWIPAGFGRLARNATVRARGLLCSLVWQPERLEMILSVSQVQRR